MKKRIIFFSLFLLVIISSIYLIEPLTLNPFGKLVKLEMQHRVWSANEVASGFLGAQRASANSNNFSEEFIAGAEALLQGGFEEGQFIGANIGVYEQDKGAYVAGMGYQNKQRQLPVSPNMLHRMASVTKPMTAVAIMQLYEQGEIDLDAAIQTYLPMFPEKSEGQITIRHLLNHTSGIAHYTSNWDGISFTNYANLTEALGAFKDRPLSFSPGMGYEYTTFGYTILGAVIEQVSGKSYASYMQENIWSIAGMNNTSVEKSDTVYQNKGSLYVKLGSIFIKAPQTDLSVKVPGGGVQSTAEDMLKFGAAIINHRLIDSSTLDLMLSSTSVFKEGMPYGFGWQIFHHDEIGRILQHGGSQSGTSTHFVIYLDQKKVVTAMANNFGSDAEMYWMTRNLYALVDHRKN